MATGVAKTTYLSDILLNEVLRNTNYTPPSTVYLALFTAAPGESGGGTEVSGGGYARQAITFGAPVDNSPDGRRCTNSSAVSFPTATADWGTITHVAIFDALTGGNMLYYGTLGTSRNVLTGDDVSVPAGDLFVGED